MTYPPRPPEWLLRRYPLASDEQPKTATEPLDMAITAVTIAGLVAFCVAYAGISDVPLKGWLFMGVIDLLALWGLHRTLRSICHQVHVARQSDTGETP